MIDLGAIGGEQVARSEEVAIRVGDGDGEAHAVNVIEGGRLAEHSSTSKPPGTRLVDMLKVSKNGAA